MRGLLGELLSRKHELTIVDMEAGLEHLSRSGGTLAYVDSLLVVVEPYRKALLTAQRAAALARDLGIPDVQLVANKVRDDREREEVHKLADSLDLPVAAIIPYDDDARTADRLGLALADHAPDSPALAAIEQLLDDVVASKWEAAPA